MSRDAVIRAAKLSRRPNVSQSTRRDGALAPMAMREREGICFMTCNLLRLVLVQLIYYASIAFAIVYVSIWLQDNYEGRECFSDDNPCMEGLSVCVVDNGHHHASPSSTHKRHGLRNQSLLIRGLPWFHSAVPLLPLSLI